LPRARTAGRSLDEGRAQRQQRRRFEPGRGVGEHHRDGLVLDDRLAERPARRRNGWQLQRTARDADRLRRDTDAPAVARLQREYEPAAWSAQDRIVVDFDAVEHERRARRSIPSLFEPRDRQPAGVAWHDERGDALVARAGVGHRPRSITLA
jgi:hypothetical protein